MADKTYTLEIIAKGLREVTKGIEKLNAETAGLEGAQGKATAANAKHAKSQREKIKNDKGASQSTNNQTKAFSKMAQGMEGTLVPAYASVAANVFALTAAFGALSRAADLSILLDASEQLATTTGRNLAVVAQGMKVLTGEAISLKEALVNASLAASAGFDNDTIEQLTKVARDASVALGRDMTDSLNRIFKGAIKAEPELLDELGIIVRLDKASRDYAATLGKNVKNLTTFEKQTAVVNAVLAEGQKKFEAIQDVDVNPYSKLAAAFQDVAVTITNFLGAPLSPFISFLTENVESLTAVLVIFGASILRNAFPALSKFSELVETKMTESVNNLQDQITKLNKFKLSLLPKTQVNAVKKSGDKLKVEFEKLAERYRALGRPVPLGIQRTLEAIPGSAKQAEHALRSLNTTAMNMDRGAGSAINLTTTEVIALGEAAQKVKDSRVALDKTAKSAQKVTGVFATVAEAAANAGIAVATFGQNVVQATFKSISAVSQQIGVWNKLKQVIIETKTAATAEVGTFSRVFGTIGAFAGGAGAALFGLIPIIGSVTIAWQILSSTFGAIKIALFGEDIVKLDESLADLEKTLNTTAKSAKFFKTNLKDLPNTLENINAQLTLQSNILNQLSSDLNTVINDVDLEGGFGIWSRFIDLFGFGDLDNFKDSLEAIVEQANQLGFDAQVSEILKDYGDIAGLSAEEARKLGNELDKLTKSFRDNAQGAKEAAAAIEVVVSDLGKSVTQIAGSLPTLSGIQKAFININDLLLRVNTDNATKLVSTLQQLDTFSLEEFGLESLVDDSTDITNELRRLETELINVREERQAILDQPVVYEEDRLQVQLLNASLQELNLEIQSNEESLEDFAITAVEQLQKVSEQYNAIIDAQKSFQISKLEIDFKKVLPSSSILDEDLLRTEELEIQLNLIEEQGARMGDLWLIAGESAGIAKERAENIQNELAGLANIAKNQEKIKKLEIERAKASDEFVKNQTLFEQLDASIQQNLTKTVNLWIDDIKQIEKELKNIYNQQIRGVQGLDAQAGHFEERYKRAVRVVAETAVDLGNQTAAGFADAQLKKLQELESYRKFLFEQELQGPGQVAESTLRDRRIIQETERELQLNAQLNNTLDQRIDREQLLTEELLKRQLAAIEERQFNVDPETIGGMREIARLSQLQLQLLEAINTSEQKRVITNKKIFLEKLNLANKELLNARQLANLGARTTQRRLDELKVEQKLAQAKGLTTEQQKDLEASLLATAKISREIAFAEELTKGAEAMNELADAMARFNDMAELSGPAAGARLLADTLDEMNGSVAQFGKGMATISQAVMSYNTTIATANTDTERQQALMGLTMNTLGALAGSFNEGSDAAKLFTIAQQGVAIATAAAAVAEAGTKGDPYTAPARVAAMLALMSSVLAAFGVGGVSGGGSNAESTKAAYTEQFGNDRLLKGESSTNALLNSVEDLVAIDTQLFGATRDLQISMKNLVEVFERIGAIALGNFSGTNLTGYNIPTSATESLTPGILDSLDNILSLGLGLGGPILDSFFGSTEVKTNLIDAGIEFATIIKTSAEGISGDFARLEQKTVQLVEETTEKYFGLSKDTNTYIQELFTQLPSELYIGLTGALEDTFTVVNGLVSSFAGAVGGIDLEALFSGIEGQIFGQDFLSLFELEGEEASEAIASYFSTLTNDILEATLPFLNDYTKAGETLLDTLIRLTAQTISISNALRTVGVDLGTFFEFSITDIPTNIALVNQALEELNQAAIESGRSTTYTASVISSRSVDESSPEAVARAQAKVASNVSAAWTTALAAAFKDDSEFSDLFDKFAQVIFDEVELLNFALGNAADQVSLGFEDLITTATQMGRLDLVSILQNAADPGEALAEFWQTAIDTDAFKVVVNSIGTEINTLGADLLATATKVGAATYELEDLQKALDAVVEKIDDLNESYLRQIALFGLLGKEADLLALAFDFNDAIKEAEETGSNLALVEEAYGLERLAIVKQYFEQIENEIIGVMDSILSSTIDIAKNSSLWDDVAFSVIKINKLVTQLSKGTSGVDLSSLIGDTSNYADFIDNFQYIIDSLSEEGPGTVSDEIQMVDDLRQAIMDRYSAELALIESQADAFKDLSQEIQNYLDALIISDRSPLTNFERLNEAQEQFITNAANIFSDDADVAANAASNLLSSADSLLEVASTFFAIGPEYLKIFELVTGTLQGIDNTLIEKLTTDPTIQAIENLNATATEQLALLDSILVELQVQNEAQLASDVAASITEGMAPLIGDIVDKLQSIDDGSWTTIIELLESHDTSLSAAILAIEAAGFDAQTTADAITALTSLADTRLVDSANILLDAANTLFVGDNTVTYAEGTFYAPLIEILETINQTGLDTIAAIESITIADTTAEVDTLTGEISGLDQFNPLIPELQTGTAEIPEDMLVKLHKGETVIPPSFSEGVREGKITLGIPANDDQMREGSVNLLPVQDNSDVVEAIRDLTQVLAISQEDIAEAAAKNVEASRDIANSVINLKRPVSTKEVA